jgi:thiamine biosynthesis lipoprotein
MTAPAPWAFEAIGTVWRIRTAEPLAESTRARVLERIQRYDRAFSRFRPDSLVARHAAEGGAMEYPAEAAALFALYDRVGELTAGRVTPMVGDSLERLGYDAHYSFRPTGEPLVPQRTAMSISDRTVTLQRPALIDVGAAGKGQLVDLVAGVLTEEGHASFTVDAGGDVRHEGAPPLRVGLEHPHDPTAAIGVVTLTGERRAIAGSASNRRRWGDGWHHILDGTTGTPVRSIVATWVLAPTTMVADLLATALFFVEGERIDEAFDVDWVRVHADGRFERSASLPGELFTR